MKYELGRLESELVFTLEGEDAVHFTVDDAMRILDASEESVWKTLHRLVEKGRIQRVKRGHYLLVPARAGYEARWRERVIRFIDGVLDEYYVGYWSALNYWHMTEQIPRTVFIATKKRRRSFTYDETVPIRFITLNPRKFFGYTREEVGGGEVNISDPEKTVIDSLDLPQYSGGITEVADALSHNLDPDKLVEYADRLDNRTVHKRLGYLIQLLDLDYPSETVTHLREGISAGYSWLDPAAPKKIHHYEAQWNLKINIPPSTLGSGVQ